MDIRKQVEERIVHLNAILQSVRNVNRLITKVKDRKSLLKGVCDNFIKGRGYKSAWIAIIDGDGRFITAEQAGFGDGFPAMLHGLKQGELTQCMRQALSKSGVVVVEDPGIECGDCSLVSIYADKIRMIVRLEHEGSIYGFVIVIISGRMVVDEEERSLFEEVADDIAFALHSLETLKEREKAIERIRNLMESLPIGVSISTQEGAVPEVNKAVWKIFGYDSKEEFQKIPAEKHYYDSKERDQFVKLHKKGLIKNFEARFKRKDGSVFWGSVTSTIQRTDSKKIEFINIFEDITERKQAVKALLEGEQRYRTLFEDSIDAIVITDKEGKLFDVNQAALDLLGYTKVEILGMYFRELYVDPFDGKQFQKQIDQKGFVTNYAVKIRKKDGTELDCLFTVSTKRADDGSVVGYQGFIRDITEIRNLEEQFRQSQKMEAIGTLAGGVAHDFNNILTTIIGNSALALLSVGKDDTLREEIEEIRIAGERAASLTRQLLAFSRKQIVRPINMNLNELLIGANKMLGRLIGEDIELLTHLGPELWQVQADQGQLEQVIINLVINAKDAMPEGGRLIVETANEDLNGNYFYKHGIKEKQPGLYVMLAVSDTGTGIDKETREHIFEPFFTTKQIGKGTGLGLSTVYGIVKQNNGFIWVYSEPGQGTTFKIYLPKVKVDMAFKKKERHSITKLDGSEIILIVEDDTSLRKLTQKALQQHGYILLEAENGEHALRVAEAYDGTIDLMITDVVMPRMSGKETADKLQPLYPKMKVIYMSGYTDNAIVHHGVLAPGLHFLEKPFTPEGLAKKVREVLDDLE